MRTPLAKLIPPPILVLPYTEGNHRLKTDAYIALVDYGLLQEQSKSI